MSNSPFLQLIHKHYTRILKLWPHDALRPTVSFQKTLQHRIDNRLSPSPSSSTSPSNPADNVVANEALATVPTPKPFDEKGELEQVNALYSFLENRYSRKVSLTLHFTYQALEGADSGEGCTAALVEKLKMEGGILSDKGWPEDWGLIFSFLAVSTLRTHIEAGVESEVL